jgi:pSer/pThr/pTyr-binding forkhead associated (FHA) protein
MKAELVPEDGGAPIPILRDVTVVGRREYCDVRIDHPTLSKRHAVLVKTDGLLILRDLASTNGTKVKGQRIRWAALLPDDRIAFGSQKFRVYLGPDDMPGPSERPRAASVPNGKRVTFAEPSPLGIPVVAVSGLMAHDAHDSDDWRNVMQRPPNGTPAGTPGLNDHELLIEDDDVIELVVADEDEIIDLD